MKIIKKSENLIVINQGWSLWLYFIIGIVLFLSGSYTAIPPYSEVVYLGGVFQGAFFVPFLAILFGIFFLFLAKKVCIVLDKNNALVKIKIDSLFFRRYFEYKFSNISKISVKNIINKDSTNSYKEVLLVSDSGNVIHLLNIKDKDKVDFNKIANFIGVPFEEK